MNNNKGEIQQTEISDFEVLQNLVIVTHVRAPPLPNVIWLISPNENCSAFCHQQNCELTQICITCYENSVLRITSEPLEFWQKLIWKMTFF